MDTKAIPGTVIAALSRHAKTNSVEDAKANGGGDLDRYVNDDGRKQCAALGKKLAELGVRPTHALVTEAVRTRQTALHTAEAYGNQALLITLAKHGYPGQPNLDQHVADVVEAAYVLACEYFKTSSLSWNQLQRFTPAEFLDQWIRPYMMDVHNFIRWAGANDIGAVSIFGSASSAAAAVTHEFNGLVATPCFTALARLNAKTLEVIEHEIITI